LFEVCQRLPIYQPRGPLPLPQIIKPVPLGAVLQLFGRRAPGHVWWHPARRFSQHYGNHSAITPLRRRVSPITEITRSLSTVVATGFTRTLRHVRGIQDALATDTGRPSGNSGWRMTPTTSS